jgi:hypothetical protein
MEDNGLLDDPLISGPGEKRGRAADRQTLYFQSYPTDTDRDYLHDVFITVQQFPAVERLFQGGREEEGRVQGTGGRLEGDSGNASCTLYPATFFGPMASRVMPPRS